MKTLRTAVATSSEHRKFARSIPRLQPRAIAIQALFIGVALFDLLGAIMGLSDFVMAFWNHHPFLAILCIFAALLIFAALIEFGIARLRADDPTPR